MWKNGSTAMMTSSEAVFRTRWPWQRLATRLRWLSMTPLGSRVDGDLWRRLAGAQQLRERGRAVGLAEHQDLPDARPTRRLDGLVDELRDGQQVAGARVVELEGELLGRVQRVDGGAGPAGEQHAVERQRVLGKVGAVDGEDVAAPEAPGRQAAGHQPRTGGQLTVADSAPARAVDQGRLAGPLRRVGEHERGQRHVRDGHVRVRAVNDRRGHRPTSLAPWGPRSGRTPH